MTAGAIGDRVRVAATAAHHAGATGTVVGFGVGVAIVEPDQPAAHPCLLLAPAQLEVLR